MNLILSSLTMVGGGGVGAGINGKLYRIASQIKLLTTEEATLGYWALSFVFRVAERTRALQMLGKHHDTVLHSKAQTQLSKQGNDHIKGFFPPHSLPIWVIPLQVPVWAGIVGRLRVTFLS